MKYKLPLFSSDDVNSATDVNIELTSHIYIVQFDWLISNQLGYSLNICSFDCSVLRTFQTRATNLLLVSFSFLKSRKNEINEKKKIKNVTVGSSQEIWCSNINRETRRFNGKTWRLPGKRGELGH